MISKLLNKHIVFLTMLIKTSKKLDLRTNALNIKYIMRRNINSFFKRGGKSV